MGREGANQLNSIQGQGRTKELGARDETRYLNDYRAQECRLDAITRWSLSPSAVTPEFVRTDGQGVNQMKGRERELTSTIIRTPFLVPATSHFVD